MQPEAIKALFDQQAAGYDRQWEKTAPIRQCLHFLLEPVFAGLPEDARILCVGVGTGAEMAHLARRCPGWRFMAVDPSGAMLEVSRRRAEQEGFIDRCVFHAGYVQELPEAPAYDAATCFLVSQFILDIDERAALFRAIAARLRPGGLLASSDLAADTASPEYAVLLEAWMRTMAGAEVPADALERMRRAYGEDVAVLPPAQVEAILRAGGFELPVPFFQAGLIHAWVSRRAAG
ncbi:class I SAM-dependent methyltransferase [Pseudoxanthomonas suwonensis]|jgi:Methylase involved in ubiquinone/menaquinone biosynthesis|uniref:class I SAM-dependent methyltransferase n=1 Tax=Pseudoxanthomonas suwonensis TaxID=314722 RepID=UPI000F63D3BF|nr:class I SAM-dependent methyltransferase [Pseudoxanthomonas suwonensis]KAF1702737.1 SAM-dependent methyltransferase [Pseudoxanthomonas suwonensis]